MAHFSKIDAIDDQAFQASVKAALESPYKQKALLKIQENYLIQAKDFLHKYVPTNDPFVLNEFYLFPRTRTENETKEIELKFQQAKADFNNSGSSLTDYLQAVEEYNNAVKKPKEFRDIVNKVMLGNYDDSKSPCDNYEQARKLVDHHETEFLAKKPAAANKEAYPTF